MVFQSHLGLISTVFLWLIQQYPAKRLSIPSWSDFNSILYETRICTISNFQSHLGLISTLQRIGTATSTGKKVFQSHLGLISTVFLWLIQQYPAKRLSIPSWSDFNSILYETRICTISNFQSHLGLISTLQRIGTATSTGKKGFQSHLGLISTFNRLLELTVTLKSFQSHLGLISTTLRKMARLRTIFTFNPILVWFQHD